MVMHNVINSYLIGVMLHISVRVIQIHPSPAPTHTYNCLGNALYALISLADIRGTHHTTLTTVLPITTMTTTTTTTTTPTTNNKSKDDKRSGGTSNASSSTTALLLLQGVNVPSQRGPLDRCAAVGKMYNELRNIQVPLQYQGEVMRLLAQHLRRVAQLEGASLMHIVSQCDALAWPLAQLWPVVKALSEVGDNRELALRVVVDTPLWSHGRADMLAKPPTPCPATRDMWGNVCAAVCQRKAQQVDAQRQARQLLEMWGIVDEVALVEDAGVMALAALRSALPEWHSIVDCLLLRTPRWATAVSSWVPGVDRSVHSFVSLKWRGMTGNLVLGEMPRSPLYDLLTPHAERLGLLSRRIIQWKRLHADSVDVWTARERHPIVRTAAVVLFHIYTSLEAALAEFIKASAECSTAVAFLDAHSQFISECGDCMTEAAWGYLDALAKSSSKDWKQCLNQLVQQLRNDSSSHALSHVLWTSLAFNART